MFKSNKFISLTSVRMLMFLTATLTLSKAPDIVWSILPSVMISADAEVMGTALMTLTPKSNPTYSVSFPTVNIELNSLAMVELEAVCAAPNYPLGVFSVRRVSCLNWSSNLSLLHYCVYVYLHVHLPWSK